MKLTGDYAETLFYIPLGLDECEFTSAVPLYKGPAHFRQKISLR